jgi:acetyl-CoA carboxylase biotin carboxyl carrier protein
MAGADIHGVTAPMVGVFHALKSPVAMGDAVRKGQAVCVIEAMKLMNEIVAEHDGEVVWIAAREGDMVEYGQLLMQIKEGAA